MTRQKERCSNSWVQLISQNFSNVCILSKENNNIFNNRWHERNSFTVLSKIRLQNCDCKITKNFNFSIYSFYLGNFIKFFSNLVTNVFCCCFVSMFKWNEWMDDVPLFFFHFNSDQSYIGWKALSQVSKAFYQQHLWGTS